LDGIIEATTRPRTGAAEKQFLIPCMCFPELLIRIKRHRSCRLIYRDLNWREWVLLPEGSLSELLQHEIDHLDGILATMRALDEHSLALKSQKKHLDFPPDLEPA
jgi:peptide deformylase